MCVPYHGSLLGSNLGLGAGARALTSPTGDAYFHEILVREAVDAGPSSPALAAARTLQPYIDLWGNGYIDSVFPSGSFAKGTANRSGTDLDLFISIRTDVPDTLKEIYDSLFSQLHSRGLSPKRQNVSIGVAVDGLSIDLVPGRQLGLLSTDHNFFHKKTGFRRKTNVLKHIDYVRAANRTSEIRLLKLWRNQRGLEFPSFYLEMAVIRALSGSSNYLLSSNVLRALRYLATVFPAHRFEDPANTNNIISDDLSSTEKGLIQKAARASLSSWPYIIR